MFKQPAKNRKPRLNIAPLLDMIFILLIFFVVTTTFSKLPGIKINRPDATVTDQLPPNNLLIGITKAGDFYVHKKQYTSDQLQEKIALKYQANPKLSVVIVADEDSYIKHSVTVMDICKQVGVESISIAEEITKE
ncbi:biopolymer transporter ExbD [bacterium]|jgi:biopolymer transport protein ExbD|nr:biopolymer transporter ExbD [bacterium]